MSNREKTNPFINSPEPNIFLYPGEVIVPLNPYTNRGYIIKPYYYVSNLGRIFSVATGRFEEKSLQINMSGYLEISIMFEGGQQHLLVHRAVLASFCPIPEMYDFHVDHINGNKTDNRLENLRWATPAQNNKYAVETGLTSPRSRNISDDHIIKIMELAKEGKSDKEISNIITDIKLAPETVRFIRTGQAIYGDILKRLGLDPIFKKAHNYLAEEDYDKICCMYESGMRIVEISRELNMPIRTVTGVINRFFGKIIDGKLVNTSTRHNPAENKPRKVNPMVEMPQKFIDEGIEIYPVNIYTSPLHILKPWYGITKDGRMFSMAKGNEWQEMTIRCDEKTKGYCEIGLSTDSGMKQYRVHRIILSTFSPRDDMYNLQVNHINGIKNDNRLENLEWTTGNENMQHAANLGLTVAKVAQRAPDEDIIKIHEFVKAGKTDEDISKLMNNKYTPHNIMIIRLGQKSYGPVLEKLGLSPCKNQRDPLTEEEKFEICVFINTNSSVKPLMQLYVEAGERYNVSPDTIRKVIYEMNNK